MVLSDPANTIFDPQDTAGNISDQLTEEKPLTIEDEEITSGEQNPARVILFNDAWHTFEEVIGQIIKATGCDTKRAEQITMEVHTKGKAVVFEGEMTECLRVNSVLEEISLHTQIEV
ncbi:MAG TPA: ATP-dependent Clp protease adaptor ClpS [Candidatus Acidoferrales bacterium]|nr:ATP-dependent Clp protease adaptor ClpS [Candidatus Acidoferrales bacterium]